LAVLIAHALGAKVIAIDIDDKALALARGLGAAVTINAKESADVAGAIHDATERGADVSIDALGSATTCSNSIMCLRKRGRHVQVGLLIGEDYLPRIPMHRVTAHELEIFGSHGMRAAKYRDMLAMIVSGKLNPRAMIGKAVPLEDAPKELAKMGRFGSVGITIIDRF
jgi:alcohol dehydrogenase